MKKFAYRGTGYGEFEFIARKIPRSYKLEEAHRTPMGVRKATHLLKYLSLTYFKDERLLKIKWLKRGKWNLAGVDFVADKRIPIVELHPGKKNIKKGWFGLRAGIVLHEFSHALANYNSKTTRGEGHNRVFISTFKKVLRKYNAAYNNQ